MVNWHIESIDALSGHRLRVRFADGLQGVVQLKTNELTGVLEPLREEAYFARMGLVGRSAYVAG